MQRDIPLSKLVSSRRNPRRVKPQAEAHRRLVASIRAFGLLEPLIVRPVIGDAKRYQIVAGYRRLAALKEVHRGSKQDPRIPCEVREVEDGTAEALSLSENFAREAMHPLDEAETFARLAGAEGKDAEAIAAQFGVSPKYVRQRMKLATLATPIQAAYREGQIDTATAEAFAAVPEDRQLAVWQEMGGHPRHAEHVRNVIANAWIDASHALFDIAMLPESAVSQDLFGERVLVERQAFMEAQAQAVAAQREALADDGWAEAVGGRREDVQDRLYAMDSPEREYDEKTANALAKLDSRRQKLEEKAAEIEEGDEAALSKLQEHFEALESQEHELVEAAPEHFSDATKAVGTVFLILDPDGRVRREYRVPRHRRSCANGKGAGVPAGEPAKPPTSEDLSDGQLAATFAHQALAVREALLEDAKVRKRVLALILHEKVRSEALSVRHEANGVTLHATQTDGFISPALDSLRKLRAKLDPFTDDAHVEDGDAYDRFGALGQSKLDGLIDMLIAEHITAHALRRTELVHRLAAEMGVNVRRCWRPDAAWLAGYRKIQLTHLLAELRGPTYSAGHDQRKKSELVQAVAQLFADAAEGKLEDKQLAERVNQWLPANLRAPASTDGT